MTETFYSMMQHFTRSSLVQMEDRSLIKNYRELYRMGRYEFYSSSELICVYYLVKQKRQPLAVCTLNMDFVVKGEFGGPGGPVLPFLGKNLVPFIRNQ